MINNNYSSISEYNFENQMKVLLESLKAGKYKLIDTKEEKKKTFILFSMGRYVVLAIT